MSVIKKGLRKSKKLLFTDEENRVRKATASDTPDSISQSLLGQIANDSYNIVRYDGMYTMLWKRLSDNLIPNHVYKALLLIGYLLENGDSRLVRDIRRDKKAIEALQRFETSDNLAQRLAENIRVQATVVLSLLENTDVLSSVRTTKFSDRDDLENDYYKSDAKGSILQRNSNGTKNVRAARSLSISAPPSARLSITSDEDDNPKLSAKKLKPKKKKAPASASHRMQSAAPNLKEARRHRSKSRKSDMKTAVDAKRAARKIKRKSARTKKEPDFEEHESARILNVSVSEPIRESSIEAPLASLMSADNFDDFDSELMGDYDRSPSPAQNIIAPSSEPHLRPQKREAEKSNVGGLGVDDFALFASVHEARQERGDKDLLTGFETMADRWKDEAVSDTSSDDDDDDFETDEDDDAITTHPAKKEETLDLPGIDLLDMENLAGPLNIDIKKRSKSSGTTLKVIEEKVKSEKADAERAAKERLSNPAMQGDISEIHVSPSSYILRGEGRAVKADQYGLPVRKKVEEPESIAAYPINWHKF